MHAVAPEWVLKSLKELHPDMNIGFEADLENYEEEISEVIIEDENKHDCTSNSDFIEEEEEVEIIGGSDHAQVVMQSIKSVEDAWHDMAIKQEKVEVETLQEPEIEEEGKVEAETQMGPGLYVTRSGRVSRPPSRLIETAYAVIREKYHQNFSKESDNVNKEIVECTYSMQKEWLFQNVMKSRPNEAMKALREEVIKAVKINILHPVHYKDLSEEERKLVIPQMIDYLEKYKPDATFDKFKVRVLARGDKQVYTGDSEGPVARIETLLMLLAIAVHEDLAIFKVDVGFAFMRTPISQDVKHKWVKLDKRVVQLLLELEYDPYKDYVQNDGSVIVKMDKLNYGYVEAVHYWYETLMSAFKNNQYAISGKDKCMFIKHQDSSLWNDHG